MASSDTTTLPRQFLRPLLAIALTSGSSYGYQLAERLQDLGLQMIDTAAIYRMLRAMEHEQLVRSWWESSDAGPRRRVYDLTDKGREAASLHTEEIIAIRDLLSHAVAVALAAPR